jgi:uncharacterized alkaline shock family protein YloU
MSNEGIGRVDIAPEVIQLIASHAAIQVKGVASLKGGVVGDLNQLFGRKNLRQGVKVDLDEQIQIEVAIVVQYGHQMVQVGNEVQAYVKQQVEEMTSLEIDQVVVQIVGVQFPQSEERVQRVK